MAKFKPGRAKTGGRTKGSGGVKIYATLPKDVAVLLPENPKEKNAFIAKAVLEYIKALQTPIMNKEPITPKVGDSIYATSIKEEFTILEVQSSGYLTIQLSTMIRAGLPHGKEVIHVNEIDGIKILLIKALQTPTPPTP